MHSFILFDGVCNFCVWWVNLLIKYDKNDKFRFASLQSEIAKKIIQPFNLPRNYNHSVIFISNEKLYTKSTAVLKIISEMPLLWQILRIFTVFPAPIRDWFYNLISKYRYNLFGKKEICIVPDEKIRKKFL